MRRFKSAPSECRCTATTVLSDQSLAQCMRRATHGELCTQHHKLKYRSSKKYAVLSKRKNPLYRTGRYLLKTKERPDGRSNKVRYFLPGMQKPWKKSHGFGPEWNKICLLSDRQAARIMAMRNPRAKTKVVRVKCGRQTLELRLLKRSR